MTLFLSILGAIGTGGLSLLGSILPGLATTIGDVWLKSKQTDAARESAQDAHGAVVAGSFLHSVTEANRARVEARKNEGAWGPLGIVTFIVGIAFAIHAAAVVADSLPFLPGLSWTAWGLIPYPALVAHVPCRCVVALPEKFQDVELAIFQALFYTAPPAAAAVAVAKAFRR